LFFKTYLNTRTYMHVPQEKSSCKNALFHNVTCSKCVSGDWSKGTLCHEDLISLITDQFHIRCMWYDSLLSELEFPLRFGSPCISLRYNFSYAWLETPRRKFTGEKKSFSVSCFSNTHLWTGPVPFPPL
jgi:hypothetical protein